MTIADQIKAFNFALEQNSQTNILLKRFELLDLSGEKEKAFEDLKAILYSDDYLALTFISFEKLVKWLELDIHLLKVFVEMSLTALQLQAICEILFSLKGQPDIPLGTLARGQSDRPVGALAREQADRPVGALARGQSDRPLGEQAEFIQPVIQRILLKTFQATNDIKYFQLLNLDSVHDSKWWNIWSELKWSNQKKEILTRSFQNLDKDSINTINSAILQALPCEHLALFLLESNWLGLYTKICNNWKESFPILLYKLKQSNHTELLIQKSIELIQNYNDNLDIYLNLILFTIQLGPDFAKPILLENIKNLSKYMDFNTNEENKLLILEIIECAGNLKENNISLDMAKLCLPYFVPFLETINEDNTNEKLKSLIGLIMTKWVALSIVSIDKDESGFDRQTLADLFIHTFIHSSKSADEKCIAQSLEGLSYLSCFAEIKNHLALHSSFLVTLVNYVNKSSPSKALIYGIVLILAHLTKFPSVLTEEQKQIEKLKKLSVSKDNIDAINREKEEKDVRNQPNAVLERIKIVMDAGCCAMLVKLFKFVSEDVNQQQERKAYEENSALLIIRIWWCLAHVPETRSRMVKEGVVKHLLSHCSNNWRKSDQILEYWTVDQMPVIPYVAAHTLAQIAISVNPVIAFGGSTSTGSVNLVNPLMNLVKCDAVPQICWFESLLALTNLASMISFSNGSDNLETRLASEVAEKFIAGDIVQVARLRLFDDNEKLRCASVELIGNLLGDARLFEKVVMGKYPPFPPSVKPSSKTLELWKEYDQQREQYYASCEPKEVFKAVGNRMKIFLALCDSDDPVTLRAASGVLAMSCWDARIQMWLLDGYSFEKETSEEGRKTMRILVNLIRPNMLHDVKLRGLEILKTLINSTNAKGFLFICGGVLKQEEEMDVLNQVKIFVEIVKTNLKSKEREVVSRAVDILKKVQTLKLD